MLHISRAGSGKTHTMFGSGRNDDGLLNRSVDYMLKVKGLSVSCVELAGKVFHDLLDKRKTIVGMSEPTKKMINSTDAFNTLIANVIKLRLQKQTDQNKTSSRSHLFINFEDGAGTKISFVDLAGWESPKNKLDIDETKFINSSLSSLNTALEKIATGFTPSFDTALTKAFKPYLRGSSKICMLYHVSSVSVIDGLKNIKNVVAANKTKTPFQNITNTIRL